MTDFHSHILPDMDDGSRSAEESIKMIGSYSDRITDVFLTPHFYAWREHPESFLERRKTAAETLEKALDGISKIRFHLGAEVAYFEGIHASEAMEKLRIGDTRLLLVEMPMREWNERMIDELVELNRNMGIRPVLAHIDRYGFAKWQKRRLFEYYLDNRGLVQVNADAILSPLTRRTVISMMRRGEIHFMGTDAHNTDTRKPNYDAALDRLIRSKAEDTIEYIGLNETKYI